MKKIQSFINYLCSLEYLTGNINIPIKSKHKTVQEQIEYYDSIIEKLTIPDGFKINDDKISNGKLIISFTLLSKDINVSIQKGFDLINQ